MKEKILCVDDEVNVLQAYQRNLRKDFTIDIAEGGEEALAKIAQNGPYAVIVADMQMPGMNGVELLSKCRDTSPDMVRLMLTGNADQGTAIQAVNQGQVFQFLTKPCTTDMLAQAMAAGIRQHRLITAERELLENTLGGSIRVLSEILSMVDPKSFEFSQKLVDAVRIFISFNRRENGWELEIAAMLSCVGFVALPPVISLKIQNGQSLTKEESDVYERLPDISYNLLCNIPRLENVAKTIRYQKKNFDGTGYPIDPYNGELIPEGSRIIRALSYMIEIENKGGTRQVALESMRNKQGWFDPQILDAMFSCFNRDESAEADLPKKIISADALSVGCVVAANIETIDDMLLVPKQTRISAPLLEKLRNFAKLKSIREPIYIYA